MQHPLPKKISAHKKNPNVTQDGHGKLESPWVGPYIVTKVVPGGAYRLQDKKTCKDESNPWNAEQLRRFYA
jgi:hypothetical protein